MQKLLIVSSSDKDIEMLQSNIKVGFNIMSVKSHTEAKKVSIVNNFDVIIIDLTSDYGINLAKEFIFSTMSQIILVVRNDLYDYASTSLESMGIITIAKPINKTFLNQVLKIAAANNARIKSIQQMNIKLSNQIKDLKLINKAKWILVSQSNMDEEFAHKYIEKLAMTRRKTKREIAESIIASYEN